MILFQFDSDLIKDDPQLKMVASVLLKLIHNKNGQGWCLGRPG